MDAHQNRPPPPPGDFSRFWRIPEGDCELLAARYSRQSFGRHSHDRYAVGVISGGVEKLFYRGSHHLATQGCVVTISPGEIHDGVQACDQGWVYRMLYIDPQWLNRAVLGQRLAADHIHLFRNVLSEDPAFARWFLQQHQRIEHADSSLERESILLELLAQLFQRNGVRQPATDRQEREAVKRIRQRLDDDFEQSIRLEELAALVNLEPLYMIRVFKNSLGISPHSYQIQRRIARVQHLLRSGASITEASFHCGFFDQSHMTRAFKKVVGITPGHFRHRHT
ncbi:AraC family transcriptional regulator [Pseudomonas sp. St29]|uniref:AraC family transcriptional regulator n=1 Tax=Pseudomonas sp. St29 TaxID=1500687 RepID=UPI0005FCCE9D|nr:AraC family transcriptional regulator [Pseudomonas sp. St29]BAQ82864.1 AraC family transcriptional regulator [Pseudomonas sp. St29]